MKIKQAVGSNIVQPVTPPAKVRPIRRDDPHIETEQEKRLREYTEARKRQRRVTFTPKTETQEEIEMARIEGFMTGIGLMASVVAIVAALALIVHYFNWWMLIVIGCVTGIVLCGRELGWW